MQNKYLFQIVFSLFLAFVLLGCVSQTPRTPKKVQQVPSWVNAVLPNDTPYSMYGMGIAKTRELAIKVALSDMVAKLGTSIQSSFESVESSSKYTSSLDVKQKITSEIAKIQINNYKVIQSFRISYKEFAVMIQSDKQKFISGLKTDLQVKKESILQRYNAVTSRDILSRYNTKKALKEEAKKLLPAIFILEEVDRNYKKQNDLNFVKQKEQEFLQESNKLQFYVYGNAKSKPFIQTIKNHLAKHGFKLARTQTNAVKVQLALKERISTQSNIAVLNLNVKVYSKNSQIGGKSIIMKERYNGSMQAVYKNASIHLKQDIQTQGVNELIGINLRE